MMQARTPAQHQQMPALHRPDLQRPTRGQRRRNASNKDSSTLVMTLVQCGQGCQRDAKENAIAVLARLSKAELLWTNAGYSGKATGNNNECNNNASPATVASASWLGIRQFVMLAAMWV
jgi:hypothetical protein